jgi:tRNA(Arg) A34 adenosine deaminase TadA
MCLGALYYAAPERVVFAATREQEGEHYEDGGRYFSLATFYDEYARPEADRSLPMSQGEVDDPQAPFRRYRETHADS